MGEQSLAVSRDPHEFFARHEFVARDGSWMRGDEIEAKLVTRTRAKDPNFAVRGLAECRQLLRDTNQKRFQRGWFVDDVGEDGIEVSLHQVRLASAAYLLGAAHDASMLDITSQRRA